MLLANGIVGEMDLDDAKDVVGALVVTGRAVPFADWSPEMQTTAVKKLNDSYF